MKKIMNKIIVAMLIFTIGFGVGSRLTCRRIESAVNMALTEKTLNEMSTEIAEVCYYEYY